MIAIQDEWIAIAAAGGPKHVAAERLQDALATSMSTLAALPAACQEHLTPVSKLACTVRKLIAIIVDHHADMHVADEAAIPGRVMHRSFTPCSAWMGHWSRTSMQTSCRQQCHTWSSRSVS